LTTVSSELAIAFSNCNNALPNGQKHRKKPEKLDVNSDLRRLFVTVRLDAVRENRDTICTATQQ
jgi:hypothetical protein